MEFFKRDKLIVGGVPEHFNSPWHLAMSNGIFQKYNVDVEFKSVPEGSGKMVAGLKDKSLDVAIILTEAIVNDIASGSSSRLIATYVESPLTWGIFVKPDSSIQSIADLKGKTIGISRIGSGSHLMSYVLADQQEWKVDDGDLKFEILNNITGLKEGIRDGKCDAFMWEQFMTKPYVDSGELRKIGVIVTPWPCFMIAVREEILKRHFNSIRKMLLAIQESARNFQNGGQSSIDYISTKFNLKPEDAKEWFSQVRFSQDGSVSRRVLVKTMDTLSRAHILNYNNLSKDFSFSSLYDRRAVMHSVDMEEIQTIQLHYAQRMRNELKDMGKESGPLTEDEIKHLDQLHYFGEEVVMAAANFLKLNPGKRVLDVGSGLGGPARLLAEKFQVQVDGVEIERDRCELAMDITKRCNLDNLCRFFVGDINTVQIPAQNYHHFVSWLVFLHIQDKIRLFSNLYEKLLPNGTFIIEDFVKLAPFSEEEKIDLEVAVACPYVPGFTEYQKVIEAAGFVDVITEDISSSWSEHVHERLKEMETNRNRNVRIHGEKITEGLHYFYTIIDKLFQGGNLGGIRITGRKGNRIL